MINPRMSTIVVMAGEATTAGSRFMARAAIGRAAPVTVEVVTCTVKARATTKTNCGNPSDAGTSIHP